MGILGVFSSSLTSSIFSNIKFLIHTCWGFVHMYLYFSYSCWWLWFKEKDMDIGRKQKKTSILNFCLTSVPWFSSSFLESKRLSSKATTCYWSSSRRIITYFQHSHWANAPSLFNSSCYCKFSWSNRSRSCALQCLSSGKLI